MSRRWQGVLAVEGVQTGDGRIIAEGALEWAELPLPLAWLKQGDQHVNSDEAPVIGLIESIERKGQSIIGEGPLDEDNPDGAEVIRQMSEGLAPGGERFFVSIDVDDYEVEVISTKPLDEDEEGVIIVGTGPTPKMQARQAGAGDGEPEGEVIMESAVDDIIERATHLRIRGATLVAVPAFAEAFIELAGGEAEESPEKESVVIAGNFPTKPPKEWFTNPNLEKLQRYLSIENGRVFGHAAGWKECHLSYPNLCLDPPQSGHDYAYFQIGQVETASGELVETGPIALKGGHASLNMDHRAAQAHYDDPSTAIADVVLGEDEFGIWFSGALRPAVSEEDVRCFRASGVSGDWRKIGDRLELVGICSVNVPGYPKVMARVASGEVVALVAAGGKPEGDKEPDLEDRVRELEAKVRHLNPSILESLRVKVSSD